MRSCKWRYISKQHSHQAWFISVGKAHSDMSSGNWIGLELPVAFYHSTHKSSTTEYQIPGIRSPLFIKRLLNYMIKKQSHSSGVIQGRSISLEIVAIGLCHWLYKMLCHMTGNLVSTCHHDSSKCHCVSTSTALALCESQFGRLDSRYICWPEILGCT